MLTQAEADALIAMGKTFARPSTVSMPGGTDVTYDLVGDDPHERFLLDLWRGTLKLSKLKFQARGKKVIVLVRLDIDGAPHTNPDGNKIGGTHLHVYREGYEDRWALLVDPAVFPNPTDMARAYTDFCQYCNIKNAPLFQATLT